MLIQTRNVRFLQLKCMENKLLDCNVILNLNMYKLYANPCWIHRKLCNSDLIFIPVFRRWASCLVSNKLFSLTLHELGKQHCVYYLVQVCASCCLRVNFIYLFIYLFTFSLKHKDSFGKSENLSKIFFAEILVFDHDYEGKSSSSNGLLWISFIFFIIIYLNYFSNCSEGLRTNLYTLSIILCKV